MTKLILINHMMSKDPILLILKVRSVEILQDILINVYLSFENKGIF